MAKNSINDLRNHLFMLLEDLTREDLTEEERNAAVEKAHAGAMLGKVIVDSAKAEIMFENRKAKHFEKTGEQLPPPDIFR